MCYLAKHSITLFEVFVAMRVAESTFTCTSVLLSALRRSINVLSPASGPASFRWAAMDFVALTSIVPSASPIFLGELSAWSRSSFRSKGTDELHSAQACETQ